MKKTSKTINSVEFVNTYNNLDKFMRENLKKDIYVSHNYLLKQMVQKGNKEIEKHYEDLKIFSNLRNTIVHENSFGGKAIAEPHKDILKLYKDIVKEIITPRNALDTLAVEFKDLYTEILNSNTLDVVKEMHAKGFSNVPIMRKNKIIGVFSENTIFAKVARDGFLKDLSTSKINDFRDHISLTEGISEYYVFIDKNATALDATDLFLNNTLKRRRIGAIFVTKDGTANSKVLGMITPWDI